MDDPVHSNDSSSPPRLRFSEDWLANLIGGSLLLISLVAVSISVTDQETVVNPLGDFFMKPVSWTGSPLDAWRDGDSYMAWPRVLGTFATLLALMGLGVKLQGQSWVDFARGFIFVFILALVALTIAANAAVKTYNLEYALWALGIGLLISNTVGTPAILKPAVLTEFYIKTGLVLYGAKQTEDEVFQLSRDRSTMSHRVRDWFQACFNLRAAAR